MKETFDSGYENESYSPGLERILRTIEQKDHEVPLGATHLIAVCGVSTSGKTHLAHKLSEVLAAPTNVLSVDSFLDPQGIDMRDQSELAYRDMELEGFSIEGIDPRLWDFPRFIECVRKLMRQ